MSTLVVAVEGPCKGHPCDNCKTCRSGRCCRRDNPDYRLPELGEWDGPIYGELGVLNDDGDKVECHCCGGWYQSLPAHLWWTHNLLPAEYRSIFGLNNSQKLVSDTVSRKLEQSPKNLAFLANKSSFAEWTPEQLFDLQTRPRRLQHKKMAIMQNAQATSRWRRPATSQYVGVQWHAGKWDVRIQYDGKPIYIGRFPAEEEAARAYDAKARELYGDQARLNFPDER